MAPIMVTPNLLKVGVACVGVFTANKSIYTVKEGHDSVVSNRIFGVKDKVYHEGRHMVIPWLEKPVIYDIRALPQEVESTHHLIESGIPGRRDQHEVKISLEVVSRPVSEKLPNIYQTLGENYKEKILPTMLEELKDVVAQYNASQLVTRREDLKKDIQQALEVKAAAHNIAIEDVSIKSLTFSDFIKAAEPIRVGAEAPDRGVFFYKKDLKPIVEKEAKQTISSSVQEAVRADAIVEDETKHFSVKEEAKPVVKVELKTISTEEAYKDKRLIVQAIADRLKRSV